MGKKQPMCNLDFLFQDFLTAFKSDAFVSECDFEVSAGISKSAENYLSRGERLETLARTAYQTRISRLALTDAEKQIFSFALDDSMTYMDVVHKISRVFTRPCLQNMSAPDDVYAKMLLDAATFSDLKLNIAFLNATDSERSWGYLKKAVPEKKRKEVETDTILSVSLEEPGYPEITYLGCKNTTHSKKDIAFCPFRGVVRVVDMADFFSSLIIYSYVMKRVVAYQQADSETLAQDAALYSLKEAFSEMFPYIVREACIPIGHDDLFSMRDVAELFKYPFYMEQVPSQEEELLLECLRSDGVDVSFSMLPYYRWEKTSSVPSPVVGVRHMDSFALLFLFRYKGVFPYRRFLFGDTSVGRFCWGLPKGIRTGWGSSKILDNMMMELFKKLFFVIAEEKVEQKKTYDYYEKLGETGYALSYQTKKNIPKRLADAMEKSLFNKYFGFVEFDEEVDVEKAEEIAKEFEALKEQYLASVDSQENAIRFRRLGNHKALGLYYPSAKCLCVDIRSPESLVHEYGHLLDYTSGCLSELADFKELRKLYLEHLQCQMESDASFKKVMEGGTKYSFSYFSRPTEIFARCFELYVSKVLKVHNSIVPVAFKETIYPQTEDFLKKTGDYFNTLLGNSVTEEQNKEQDEVVRWLISCPAGDINFIGHLKKATVKQIETALKDEHVCAQKSKVAKLNAQLKKLRSA